MHKNPFKLIQSFFEIENFIAFEHEQYEAVLLLLNTINYMDSSRAFHKCKHEKFYTLELFTSKDIWEPSSSLSMQA